MKCSFKARIKNPMCESSPVFVLKLGFFKYTYLRGNCATVPTPSSPDKAIYTISVKSPLNKGRRWHSIADQQTLGLRFLLPFISKSDKKVLHEITVYSQG